MEYEYERQIELIEAGGAVVQETLRYDDATGTTSSMRSKEDAHDYRYFREPDLVTIAVARDRVKEIEARLPELPEKKFARYTADYGIPEKDAAQLTKYRAIAEYFDTAIEGLKSPKTASNFIIGQIFRRLETEADKEAFAVPTTASQLNELCKLLESGKLKNNLAKTALEKMLDSGKPVTEFVSESDMAGLDEATLTEYCKNAIAAMPAAAADYQSGKEKALMAILGNVMKQSRGRADAGAVTAKLKELLS
jgi:aspartyl-tRNA(Asn)/glutamyl-tRNA(Gln) amidotransferase subunit B